MAQGLYIAGTEAGNGKSAIVLAMMEYLVGHGRRTGFFRPVIRSEEGRDSLIHLIQTRYALEYPYEAMYGCTYENARKLITAGRLDALYTVILEKYKALEDQCDVVLCAGTDYTGVSAALEFDVNVDVATNLGCLMLPVINGAGRKPEQLTAFVQALKKSLHKKKCEIIAVLINRVIPDHAVGMKKAMKETGQDGVPVYVIPEHPVLGKPTVGEIASALNARRISRHDEGIDREVLHTKVAAMALPNFLDHLEDDSLIITPGDRSDMVLGSVLSHASSVFPSLSGILLTGNIRPAPQVQRLIEGFGKATVPVFLVETDTFTRAMNASHVRGTIAPESKRKIAAALGMVEQNVDMTELNVRMTDALIMDHPPHV